MVLSIGRLFCLVFREVDKPRRYGRIRVWGRGLMVVVSPTIMAGPWRKKMLGGDGVRMRRLLLCE